MCKLWARKGPPIQVPVLPNDVTTPGYAGCVRSVGWVSGVGSVGWVKCVGGAGWVDWVSQVGSAGWKSCTGCVGRGRMGEKRVGVGEGMWGWWKGLAQKWVEWGIYVVRRMGLVHVGKGGVVGGGGRERGLVGKGIQAISWMMNATGRSCKHTTTDKEWVS